MSLLDKLKELNKEKENNIEKNYKIDGEIKKIQILAFLESDILRGTKWSHGKEVELECENPEAIFNWCISNKIDTYDINTIQIGSEIYYLSINSFPEKHLYISGHGNTSLGDVITWLKKRGAEVNVSLHGVENDIELLEYKLEELREIKKSLS